jgi:hypothetical protein
MLHVFELLFAAVYIMCVYKFMFLAKQKYKQDRWELRVTVFWDVTCCSLVNFHEFRRYLGIISWKTITILATAVITLGLTWSCRINKNVGFTLKIKKCNFLNWARIKSDHFLNEFMLRQVLVHCISIIILSYQTVHACVILR